MPKLFYKDLWGKRADKYKFLESNDVTTIHWQELNSTEPYYFFVPKDFSLKEECERFWSVKDIFIQFSSGVKTHRDHFIVGFTKEEVANKIRIFTGTLDDDTVKESLKLKDTRDWKLSNARVKLKTVKWKDVIIPYAYRAFDQRYICYCIDKKIPNLKPEFLNAIKKSIGFEPTLSEIFYYIYAVLYSPTYRKKYQEFLKIDFPRIPLPENQNSFKTLSNLGKKLVDLHLLKSEIFNLQSTITVGYPIQGTDKVEKVKYLNGRIYINKEQYFENIHDDVWNYHIGSYQVLEKFLKDRKGRTLSLDEIQRYLKIIFSISSTLEIQKGIDKIITRED